jgi:hypothetical protein
MPVIEITPDDMAVSTGASRSCCYRGLGVICPDVGLRFANDAKSLVVSGGPLAIIGFPGTGTDFQLDGRPATVIMTNVPDGSRFTMDTSRIQLPFELTFATFAITGHSAQGKTMRRIAADLKVPNAGGYIAAPEAKRPGVRPPDLKLMLWVPPTRLPEPQNQELAQLH